MKGIMLKKIIWTAVAVVIVAGVIACGATSVPGGTSEVPVTATPDADLGVTTAPPAKTVKAWGAGTYKVGDDIAAGSYKTPGADGTCYWARLKTDSGELGSILANGLLHDNAPGRLSVKATDKFVEFRGDCQWIKA